MNKDITINRFQSWAITADNKALKGLKDSKANMRKNYQNDQDEFFDCRCGRRILKENIYVAKGNKVCFKCYVKSNNKIPGGGA